MTFAERMTDAKPTEDRVMAALRARGWDAWPFGQGQLPEQARDALRRYVDSSYRPTLIRWMPDILAVLDGDPLRVALIDAKKCNGPRYAIETRAVEAAEAFTAMHIPVFFVMDDGATLTPRDVRERGFLGPVSDSTGGSGTPYLLVEKRWGREFGSVFGSLAAQERAA